LKISTLNSRTFCCTNPAVVNTLEPRYESGLEFADSRTYDGQTTLIYCLMGWGRTRVTAAAVREISAETNQCRVDIATIIRSLKHSNQPVVMLRCSEHIAHFRSNDFVHRHITNRQRNTVAGPIRSLAKAAPIYPPTQRNHKTRCPAIAERPRWRVRYSFRQK